MGIRTRAKLSFQIIYVCCERLLELASRQCTNDEHKTRLFITADRFLPSNSTAVQKSLFRSTSNQPVKAAAGHAMRHNGQVTSIPKNPLVAAISMRVSISCESLLPLRARASGTGADHLSPPPSTASLGPGSGSSTPNPRLLPSLTQPNLTWSDVTRDADVPGRLPGNATARLCRRSSIASSASAVIEALGNVKLDCSPESLVSVDDYKRKLNISPTEWWRLRAEEDPLVLAALMWDWFDELRVGLRDAYWLLSEFYSTILMKLVFAARCDCRRRTWMAVERHLASCDAERHKCVKSYHNRYRIFFIVSSIISQLCYWLYIYTSDARMSNTIFTAVEPVNLLHDVRKFGSTCSLINLEIVLMNHVPFLANK